MLITILQAENVTYQNLAATICEYLVASNCANLYLLNIFCGAFIAVNLSPFLIGELNRIDKYI